MSLGRASPAPVENPQRSQIALHGVWLTVTLLAAGLSFWAGRHTISAAAPVAEIARPVVKVLTPRRVRAAAPVQTDSNIRYVRRTGSVIRDKPKASGHVLKKESKGAIVTLVSQEGDWTKVTDGNITGWMRTSILRPDPPPD